MANLDKVEIVLVLVPVFFLQMVGLLVLVFFLYMVVLTIAVLTK